MSDTITLVGLLAELGCLADRLKLLGEHSYCLASDKCKDDLCKGSIYKIDNNLFGTDNLAVHCEVHKGWGKHEAYMDACNKVRELITQMTEEPEENNNE